jgi:hypothetical protein
VRLSFTWKWEKINPHCHYKFSAHAFGVKHGKDFQMHVWWAVGQTLNQIMRQAQPRLPTYRIIKLVCYNICNFRAHGAFAVFFIKTWNCSFKHHSTDFVLFFTRVPSSPTHTLLAFLWLRPDIIVFWICDPDKKADPPNYRLSADIQIMPIVPPTQRGAGLRGI